MSGIKITCAMAALALFAISNVNADVVTPTVADVSSQITPAQCCDGRPATYTVDGSGLDATGTMHSNVASPGMWTTTGSNFFQPPDGSPFITYDLGAPMNVTSAHIWNYNENIGTCCLGFGPKDVQVLAGNDLSSLTNRGSVVFPEADGTNTYLGSDVPMALNNVRYVRFNIKDTWGNSVFNGTTGQPNGDDPRGLTGLSEVRFNATAVPEPAMIGTLTIFVLGVLARRRSTI